MKKIAVLISGNGSNLQAIIDWIEKYQLAEISVVISNKKNVFGLERAQKNNIQTYYILSADYLTRESFEDDLIQVLDKYKVDLICLAGFMMVLTEKFTDYHYGKIINIHPSLLPKYKGLNTHQKAIENNEQFAGASIHFVTGELDGGPLIAQVKVLIDQNDDALSLAKKVNQNEIKLYPLVLSWFIKDRIKIINNNVYLDDENISKKGIQFTEIQLDERFNNLNIL